MLTFLKLSCWNLKGMSNVTSASDHNPDSNLSNPDPGSEFELIKNNLSQSEEVYSTYRSHNR